MTNDPGNIEVLTAKMFLLAQRNHHTEVLETVEKLLSAGSNDPNVVLKKVYALLGKNDTEIAWETVKPLFAVYNGQNAVIHAFLSTIYKLEPSEVANKISAYEKSLDQKAHYQLLYCMGLYHKEKQDFERSITIFSDLNKIHQFAWNYYQIAIIKNLQGKLDECFENLEKAFDLDPKLKNDAKQYLELQNLWNDQSFIKLTE